MSLTRWLLARQVPTPSVSIFIREVPEASLLRKPWRSEGSYLPASKYLEFL
jgi:hypothetical protein